MSFTAGGVQMAGLTWNDDLSVGIDLIDSQHKMMISRLNEVYAAVEEKKGVGLIVKTFDFLTDYTNFHFSTEEKHMKEQEYPEMEYHVGQHNEFKKTLNNLFQDFKEEGATVDLSESLSKFLIMWFVTHIRNTDLKFGRFLQLKGLLDLEA
jgi:hemerythrin